MKGTKGDGLAYLSWLAALVASAAPAPCSVWQPGAGVEASPRISPSDQMEIARLVDLCAKRLKLNIDYDSAVLKGLVTLRLEAALTDEEIWLLTNRLLAARGFTTLRAPGDAGGFSVVKLADAASLTRIEPDASPDVFGPEPGEAAKGQIAPVEQAARPFEAPAPRPHAHPRAESPPSRFQAGFQAVLVRVRHRTPRDVVEAVKLVLSKPAGAVFELPGGGPAPSASPVWSGQAGAGGLIMIADLTPSVHQAQRLVRLLDTPLEPAAIEEIPVFHIAPSQMVALVGQVLAKRDSGPVSGGARKTSEAGTSPTPPLLVSPAGGAVLAVAPRSHLGQWREMITQLDQREGVTIQNYAAKYFAVRDVAKLIEQSMIVGTVAGHKSAGENPGVDERFRVVVDDLTGTLIITATAAQHERVAALIERLDSIPPAARRPVRTFVIRNRAVKEIIDVLGRLLDAGVFESPLARGGTPDPASRGAFVTSADPGAETASASPTPRTAAKDQGGVAAQIVPPSRPVGGVAPSLTRDAASQSDRAIAGQARSAGSAPGAEERAVALTFDEATNTLIAVGEPRMLAQIEVLLGTLDVRQPQVMLEVLLLSLTDTETLALGAELQRMTNKGDAQINLSSVFGLSSGGGGGTGGGSSNGGAITVLSPGEFSVIVRALETLNNGRSLSVPRLLVSNNQTGDFHSTLQQPVTTTVTPSSQVTTTSFGGYEQAGTSVNVQPQIAEGDHLSLRYNVTLSSFVGQGSANVPPPRQENTLSSEVTIPDGHTVVVGGIELSTTGDGVNQVPFLGDIPLIGEAFKSRNNSRNRTRFFVFIHAEVMRRQQFDELKHLSSFAAEQAAIDDGFPVVEPRVIR